MQTAKLFRNGRSQAVRLPKEFRLEGDEVTIFHMGNAIVIQPVAKTWTDVFTTLKSISSSMPEREDLPPQEREFFENL